MQARDVHARVEALLGEPLRWSSDKATFAGNLGGPPPRFVRYLGDATARHRHRETGETPASL